MPCNCHGKQGSVVAGRVPPDSPCTLCAYKHLNMALVAWGEFTYERDNRDWVTGHLRLAVEHLKSEHRQTALDVRDLAADIELARDGDPGTVQERIKVLRDHVRGLFDQDHPDVVDRLIQLKVQQPEQK